MWGMTLAGMPRWRCSAGGVWVFLQPPSRRQRKRRQPPGHGVGDIPLLEPARCQGTRGGHRAAPLWTREVCLVGSTPAPCPPAPRAPPRRVGRPHPAQTRAGDAPAGMEEDFPAGDGGEKAAGAGGGWRGWGTTTASVPYGEIKEKLKSTTNTDFFSQLPARVAGREVPGTGEMQDSGGAVAMGGGGVVEPMVQDFPRMPAWARSRIPASYLWDGVAGGWVGGAHFSVIILTNSS